jgi:hypothetical protein
MAANTRVTRPVQKDDSNTGTAVVLLNRLILLFNNRVHPQASALPGVATATVTSQVKTTATTAFTADGVFVIKAATDNFWTLAPTGVLAAASFRRWLLLINAAGTASVYASQDSTVSAAACAWNFLGPTLPFDGAAIIGIVTVATDATHTFTPATTLLGAAGITTTYLDGYDNTIIPTLTDLGNNLYVPPANNPY